MAPSLPQNKSFKDLVTVQKQCFVPIIADRFHFHKRAQATRENIAKYIAELRYV